MKKTYFDYFKSFEQLNGFNVGASNELYNFAENFSAAKIALPLERIAGLRENSDGLAEKIVARLIKEFMPPFDREDIVCLSRSLSKVIYSIERVFYVMKAHGINSVKSDVIKLSGLLRALTTETGKILPELKNIKKSCVLPKLNEMRKRRGEIPKMLTTVSDGVACFDVTENLIDSVECCFGVCDIIELITVKNL